MKKYLIGIDFGTTTLSGVLVNAETQAVENTININTNAYLSFNNNWQKEQDLSILSDCLNLLISKLLLAEQIEIVSIGMTGQMHGIVGLNQKNEAVTNLVTWQDRSGEQCFDKKTPILAEIRAKCPDLKISNGYGLVTLYKWLIIEKRTDIASFCTIPDYFGMKLTSASASYIHPSMAHSIGAYDLNLANWDFATIDKLQLPATAFPKVVTNTKVIGNVSNDNILSKSANEKIPLYISIGDNQAGFIGSVGNLQNSLLINVGTGAQVSYAIAYNELQHYLPLTDGLDTEIRPLNNDLFLIAHNFTCGGTVYKALYNFFLRCGKNLFHLNEKEIENSLWEAMNSINITEIENEPLKIMPTFDGLRSNPALRGEIMDISFSNFTPEHFIYHTLKGLANLFKSYLDEKQISQYQSVYGSGNGVKKNKLFQQILNNTFNKKIQLTPYYEEAAVGVTLIK